MYAPRHLPTEGQANTQNWEQLIAFQFKGTALEGSLEEPTLLKGAVTGAWTKPTAFNAKLEETTTVEVRKEGNATVGRLKGFFKTKEEVVGKESLFTLPAGFRPPADAVLLLFDFSGVTTQSLRVKTTGVVESEQKLTTAHFFSIDGLTFHLT